MRLLIALCILVNTNVWGQGYTFTHPDCKIRIQTKVKANKAAQSIYEKKLKERGFKISALIEDQKLFPGELYGLLQLDRPKTKFWKDCIAFVQIKVAKSNRIKKSDKTLYKKQIKTSFPRVTPSGDERCRRAVKDAFFQIPYCRKPGQ